MACESIREALASNERARNALAARLGPAQDEAQLAFDSLQSALRLRTQNISPSFVAFYLGREFRGPNAVDDYIAFVQNDFNTKRDIRRDLGVEFNALFPEKERLEKELAECEATPTGPVASAGAGVAEASNAKAENANTQNPPVPAGNATPASSNAASTESAGTPAVAAPPAKLPTSEQLNATPPETTPTSILPTTPVPSGGRALVDASGGSDATQSYIYRAISVTHMFSKGKFTQQLEGALVIYDLPTVNTGAPAGTQSEGNAGEVEAQQNVLTRNAADAARASFAATDPRRVDSRSDAGAGRSTSEFAATDPRRVDTPQVTPPSAADSGATAAPGSAAATAPETVGPAETTPPTSGGQTVAVVPAPTPPTTINFAGATLQASLQISGRVFISLTLPSGRSEINVDGWGDQQWDSLLYSVGGLTDTRDIAAAESLKASWSGLQAQLRASVAQPVTTSAAPQNMAKEP